MQPEETLQAILVPRKELELQQPDLLYYGWLWVGDRTTRPINAQN